MSEKPVTDKWKCGYCGEEQELERGIRPLVCISPICGRKSNFEALSGPYSYFSPGRNPKFIPKKLADEITKEHHFATHYESWVIYHYDEGVYLPNGRVVIRELARERLGELAKEHYIIEVEKHIQDTTFKKVEAFDPPPELLCVKNGILNTITRELKPHTPTTIFLSKLPAEYNPEAKCPTILKRLYEWTGGNMNDMVKLIQFAGFCLYRNYFIRKAIIIHGEGDNGKTTYLLFMTRWLGESNVVGVKVQNLEKRFTAARLFGKLANLCDDLPGEEWFSTGSFKQATGGSPLEAEKKFKDEFLFCSYAKMLFTGNRMPIVSDNTLAFWDRIALIPFGQQFSGEKVRNREDLLKEMLTNDECSGFLNLALEGLASLLGASEFFAMEDMEETKKRYIKISDPVMAFGHERVMSDPEANTVKRTIYAAYVDYCREKGFGLKENNIFARSFKRVYPHIEDSEVYDEEGRRHNSWRGVALKPKDEEIPPERINNTPQVPHDSHVLRLFKSITRQLSQYKLDMGENPAEPAEPAGTPPTEPPKGEGQQTLEAKLEEIEEKTPTEPSELMGEARESAEPVPPKGKLPQEQEKSDVMLGFLKAEVSSTLDSAPTAQDIEKAVCAYPSKTLLSKAKLAEDLGISLDRLKVVIEELEQKRGAVIDRGAVLEVV